MLGRLLRSSGAWNPLSFGQRKLFTDSVSPTGSKWKNARRKEMVDINELDLSCMRAVVNKVIYHNENNGYSVMAVSPKDYPSQEVTVIGTFVSPSLGEHIEIQGGTWKLRGEEPQIIANRITPSNPTTVSETEIYLSKFFKGIGKKRAKAIVDMFGIRVFDIIENNPTALLKVSGLGSKKLEAVIQPYLERVSARELVDFFVKHDVTSDHGLTIWRKFGESAIEMIKENPYILSQEIRGFTFLQSDQLALKLGFETTDPKRIVASARHVLLVGAVRNGHCVLPLPYVLKECGRLLELPPYTIYDILLGELRSPESRITTVPQTLLNLAVNYKDDHTLNFFLTEEESSSYIIKQEVYEQERGIAADLHRISNSLASHPLADVIEKEGREKILEEVSEGLSKSQKEVVELALTEKVLVVTGGPGVGKTATVTRIIQLFEKYGRAVLVCAPTGRAAVRLQDLSGTPASTVHRLLECSAGFTFLRNETNPLNCHLLVVDEFSMMDVGLTHALFKALPSDILLVIVGDADQLPSVGPGNVLKDIISSNKVKTYHLSEVFRQKGESDIIRAAHTINAGKIPDLLQTISVKSNQITPLESDFCFIEASKPDYIVNTVTSLVTYILPQHGFSSDQIQILTPVNKNELGAKALNFNIQQQLNPPQPGKSEVTVAGTVFRVGDRVMQILNNYDKDVYNGEMGEIVEIEKVSGSAKRKKTSVWNIGIQFERQSEVCYYKESEMDQILLAYAVTIHKSQGNEFPVVVIPLHQQHWRMLQRNLIYTAITRGKKLVVVVGEKEALQTAVATLNAQGIERYTNLTETLQNYTLPKE